MDSARHAVVQAIDDVNGLLPRNHRLAPLPETALLGETSALDSLALVNLIVSLEQKIEETTGISLALGTDEGLFEPNGPMTSVGTLIDYVRSALQERGHA